MRTSKTSLLVAAIILVMGALLAGMFALGWNVGTSGAPEMPSELSVDAGFSRDMQVHHSQAVEMSLIVRDKTQDPTLQTVALDILLTQQQQSGQMYGWLESWDLPQAGTESPMAWMGMGGMPMMGLATTEQMEALQESEGVEAERMFLALMLDHHKGGVHMAEAAAAEATQSEVRRLAGAMAAAQTSEITVLEELLEERSA